MAGASSDRRAIITEALHKIDELSARLEIAEKGDTEPIAVVGMGCRLPGGVDTPDEFWRLLQDGRSGIVRVPEDRWDADAFYSEDYTVPGTICTREGGFITSWQPDEFDAEFFGISPREAAAMDPQQRLVLEVAWEALENAGIPPHTIHGTQTSAFIGMTAYDYMLTLAENLGPEDYDAYVPFGNAANFAAGRLSYFLGVRGPAVAIDTACSSSLVSVHLACQSLRRRESDTSLAVGVNLMLKPEANIALTRFGMLSPDGQCKTFDAGADGYVRSEGCGVVVLKRLSDALAAGDRVLAVVRGSAVNQDGASSGQTVPNGPAQQALMRQALAASRLAPSDIDYIEAHGTGTALGDPIELDALSAVFSDRNGSAPLVLGSVKTNLGHLESAAGITGFIKTVLSVRHGHIPKQLNFEKLTPHASEGASRFTIATEAMPWPPGAGPRRAGVSSFGASGTNAHVVIEQAPDVAAVEPQQDPPVSTLVVSGKSEQRIASTAGALAQWMQSDGAGVGLADVAHTLNHHRARHAKFATVCARDRAQAIAGLQALAAGHTAAGVVGAHDGVCGAGTVFVYSGQGSQWAGMGRQMLADEPVFAEAIAELEPVFVEQVGFSLHQLIAEGQPVSGDARVQPVIMGLQLALTELWRSHGVTPDAVIGHSMGEVTAAVVAGALTVAEGLRVIATRSQLMARLAGQGAVALLELDAEATEALIADNPQVSVAGYVSPRQTVIAGPPADVDAVIAAVSAQDRFAKRVNMEVASHTALMDPILPELWSALADLAPKPPTIPFHSTVKDTTTPLLDAHYWVANVRQPVRLHQAVTTAAENHTTFIEISPHPTLTHAITETLGGAHHHSVGTLRRDGDDTVSFHTNLNTIHTTQPPHTPHAPEPHPVLPATPWHHTSHWLNMRATTLSDSAHPLLGVGVTDPTTGKRVWENRLSPDLLWLGDHLIDEACVLPGAAYAEMALAAVMETTADGDGDPWMIRELRLEQVMPVTDDTMVATTLTGDESRARVEIRSRSGENEWVTHAIATVERASSPAGAPTLIEDESSLVELDPQDLYERLRSAGQQHGPAFQGIVGLAVSDSGAARAQVELPSPAKRSSRRMLLHPVMVDVAVQVLGATKAATDIASEGGDARTVVLPVRFAGVRAFGDVTAGTCAVGSLSATDDPNRLRGKVVLNDAQGDTVLEIDEVEMAVLRTGRHVDELTSKLFELEWQPTILNKVAPDVGGAVLMVDESGEGDSLVGRLKAGLAVRTQSVQSVSACDDRALREAISRNDMSWEDIVVVFPPREVDESRPEHPQLELAQSRTGLLVDIVKTISRRGARNSPRLWIVTRGAYQLEHDDDVTLAQTGIRGLARVLNFEHSELKATMVDVEAEGTGSVDALIEEILAGGEHDEVALRSGQRYVHRLVAAPTTATGELVPEERHTLVNVGGTDGFRLQLDQAGRLDGLKVHAVKRIPPEAGQIEIRITVSMLNFSDVLKTMGLYPGLNGQAPIIGGECVGVVSAVGDGVDSVQIGQRVIAVGPGTLGSHVTTVDDLVVPVPAELTDHQAATFGVAYMTAWHSLREVGRLAPGERVLIHSATGGVGLAAMGIAKTIGARVYATAGSDAKRQLLSELGAEYVGDSRSVAFADEILEITDGEGVDLVLNSLAGQAITRGVDILAPGGRFVELGKKDVYADASLGLAALAKSASFSVVDLDLNLRLRPKHYRRMLHDILARAAAGELEPLPVTDFDFDHVIDAFRLMASGNHTGKIVISMPVDGTVSAIASPPQPLVNSDGGYIVVGGMGGVGFVAARWLAEQGAGLVVVNGRSGPDAQTMADISKLNADGMRVEVVTGDIAAPDTAERLVRAVEDAGFRLRGVLHSATVLDDQIVLNISESAVERVCRPKVAGGWRLHSATPERDLDWWLTFSSASSLLGSPGQGAYAAANSWLDGLVAYRRSRGLPAVGINWGPWAEVGRGQSFANFGFSMITPELGMTALQRVLTADRAATGVFGLDARQWFQSFPAAAQSSLFAEIENASTIERRGGGKLQTELAAMPSNERAGRLASTIADEIRAVLRSSEPIDHNEAMASLGLDSLMALELRNRLEGSLGTTLPAALVWAYPTISDLAGALCERLGFEQTADLSEEEMALADDEMQLLADLVAASEAEVAMGAGES